MLKSITIWTTWLFLIFPFLWYLNNPFIPTKPALCLSSSSTGTFLSTGRPTWIVLDSWNPVDTQWVWNLGRQRCSPKSCHYNLRLTFQRRKKKRKTELIAGPRMNMVFPLKSVCPERQTLSVHVELQNPEESLPGRDKRALLACWWLPWQRRQVGTGSSTEDLEQHQHLGLRPHKLISYWAKWFCAKVKPHRKLTDGKVSRKKKKLNAKATKNLDFTYLK